MFALVAADRLGGFQAVEAIEAKPAQDAADACRRHADLPSDLPAGPALAPQPLDPFDGIGFGLARRALGPRGAITKPGLTLCLEARDPFADGFDADTESGGNFGLGLPLDAHPADQFGSTMRGQANILMDVHSVLPGTLKLRNSRFLAQHRMDNLLKVHS